MRRLIRPFPLLAAALCAGTLGLPSDARAAPDPVGSVTLASGWQEQDPGTGRWRPTVIPKVVDPKPSYESFWGSVRHYRLRFNAPATPPGFGWRLNFEGVRRIARVSLNGRYLGQSAGPYTPFSMNAVGLRPGLNELLVEVDSRLSRPLEAWYNWTGIVRRVRLVPLGQVSVPDIGFLTKGRCRRRGKCRVGLMAIGDVVRAPGAPADARLAVRLRSPSGRVTRKSFRIGGRRRLKGVMRVRRPSLWSPRRRRFYHLSATLRAGGRIQQVFDTRVGLRVVSVKRGRLLLNGRPLRLRGASIHEDMPGSGDALTDADMNQIVADLKGLGADVTRAHYPLDERLLDRFDRAGILVWNEAPVWHRDLRMNALRTPGQIALALGEVRSTVLAARSHPSVLVHSVANELHPQPDKKPGSRRFLVRAARLVRRLDPTIPPAVDIVGRGGFGRQRTWKKFDVLGINQYFGWYTKPGVLGDLPAFLRRLKRSYAKQALVVTEMGAEALPELAAAPADLKGSYAFQNAYAENVLHVIGRSRFLSGAIWWTLREFAIYPGWTGGVPNRYRQTRPNVIHNKGLITYAGARKPAFETLRRRYVRTPLYPRLRRKRRR